MHISPSVSLAAGVPQPCFTFSVEVAEGIRTEDPRCHLTHLQGPGAGTKEYRCGRSLGEGVVRWPRSCCPLGDGGLYKPLLLRLLFRTSAAPPWCSICDDGSFVARNYLKDLHLGSVELSKQIAQCAAMVEWGSLSLGAVPRSHVILQKQSKCYPPAPAGSPCTPFPGGLPEGLGP